MGYLLHRAGSASGPWTVLDHGGGDVLAVAEPRFADVRPHGGGYAVRAVHDADELAAVRTGTAPGGPLEVAPGPVTARVPGRCAPWVGVRVDASSPSGPLHRPWRHTVGSEHLSLLLCDDDLGGEPIGRGLESALRRVHDELGVERVRAHGILGDDLGVYREVDGRPVHDFSGLDAVLDRLSRTGLRPVFELSFMPRALSGPGAAEVTAAGTSSPPRDLGRWAALVEDLARHLRRRVGDAELARWAVEVWNEPDLDVFWRGDRDDYLALYETTARAVRRAAPALPVGGPATAASRWVGPFLQHCTDRDVPVDFVSTHCYGTPPPDLRPVLRRHGAAGVPLWWTEWGPTPTHFSPVNDTVWSACFLATGMRLAAGRVAALAPWVASDHFEELGRPEALVHGGFGLLSVRGLAKPRFHALAVLARLGDAELPLTVSGDGADVLVRGWAGRDERTGRTAVALWNAPLDQDAARHVDRYASSLRRNVSLHVEGLRHGTHRVRCRMLAEGCGDLAAAARRTGVRGWPDPDQLATLRAAEPLPDVRPPWTVGAPDGDLDVEVPLPMPSLVLVEVEPS